MEIQDAAYELLEEVWIGTSAEEGFANANVAILLGGFPRLPGMERKELITKNAEGMRDQARALDACADRDVKVLVVANPANTNALVAIKSAPSIPAQNFTALTRLDQERLRGFIVAKVNQTGCLLLLLHSPSFPSSPHPLSFPVHVTEEAAGNNIKVRASDVSQISIFGNHSTTQVPYIGAATVMVAGDAKRVSQYFTTEETNQLIVTVQNRGAEVMKAQNASSALSAANAIGKHLTDWICPSLSESHNNVFSMGVLRLVFLTHFYSSSYHHVTLTLTITIIYLV